MKKLTSFFLISLFISFSVAAKTLEQKKDELKKIYEVGGISKVEYDKAIDSLENSDNKEKKKKKKSFTLKKNTKKTPTNLFKKKDKDKDKEEITIEKINELGKIVKFDKSYYPESMIKEFTGYINSFSGIGQKAAGYMMGNFGKSPSWGQKYPGKMIKSMAMYEIFYASKLYQTKKSIERFKKNKYKKGLFSKKKSDEKAIRSLFGMNKGRKNMREALGMDMDTPTKEAIQKFWLLGEFLDLGAPINNQIIVSKDIKDRQDKLDIYKATISTLKKKLEERAEEKQTIKDKS
ncbi:hypothetical protein IDH29_05345 [Pelagibacterales bacterium SAG-MED06]|nr:hypothetical protein [Pelagibacterales bacterium SAG-MED06]